MRIGNFMLELKQHTHFKITIQKIEELILEHFSSQLNLMKDMGFRNRTYYAVDPMWTTTPQKDRPPKQPLHEENIRYYLIDGENSAERLNQAIWCLMMTDILPEGNYIVSIFW